MLFLLWATPLALVLIMASSSSAQTLYGNPLFNWNPPDSKLSPEVRKILADLHRLSAEGYHLNKPGRLTEESRAEAKERLRQFNDGLDRLGAAVDESLREEARQINAAISDFFADAGPAEIDARRVLEKLAPAAGRDLDYNLIAIALDRRRSGDQYEGRFKALGLPPAEEDSAQVGARANFTVRPEHLTEEWLPFWEYVHLAPRYGRIESLHTYRYATFALARIGEDASIPVLLHRFQVEEALDLVQGEWYLWDGDLRVSVVRALGQFKTRSALEGMLRCLVMSELRELDTKRIVQNAGNRAAQRREVYSFRELVLYELSSRRRGGVPLIREHPLFSDVKDRKSWAPVLREYPVDELAAPDRRLIESALEAY